MSVRAVLVGMPGVGKTTVGKLVARKLSVPALDSDRLIVQHAGMSIADIFTTHGVAHFRELEHQVIRQAIEHSDGILSLGGGALLDSRTRDLLADQRVVFIDASDDLLVSRLTRSRTVRPILGLDIRHTVRQLRAERDAFYHQVASDIVYSNERGIHSVVDQVMHTLHKSRSVSSVAGAKPYDVVVGSDLVQNIVRSLHPASKVFTIHSPHVTKFASRIQAKLAESGLESFAVELPDGEAAKTFDVLQQLWDKAGEEHFGRDGVVLAIGGGATTDVAGFMASTWMRGVRFVCVPTTLLGMVDAGLGGKTGIDTRHGKNLVGSFWAPSHVFCDTDVLTTLPSQEIRSGLGEIIKCGFISDPQIVTISLQDKLDFAELITRAVRVKADVVGSDFHETSRRAVLNYGHTLAHAIELVENYSWRHGQAVAVGCLFATGLAVAAGYLPADTIDQHRAVLTRLGLPTTYSGQKRELVEEAMLTDKKVRDGKLRFVVVDEEYSMKFISDPSTEMLDFAWSVIRP
ncbi:3-dehydroquinate synthase [Arcanobacterium phocisimile]|uniref:Multifunctional fusion protein n=1 Tax=Arcanobacterium phocisimile TaxID=1302235 RepID=A0ABX7IJM6_9ACTO|nr:3-dehydroquinate synthase [Arcanobacterium phocisimile]QRV02940.1 3-dehydroquinate synthase [Arcanobacterium phocisimile]